MMISHHQLRPTRKSLSRLRLRQMRFLTTDSRPFPRYEIVRRAQAAGVWTILFLFCPDGLVSRAQAATLASLRALPRRLFLVCATGGREQLPESLLKDADALAWKALPGFDFSAYAIALHEICALPGPSDVYVQNDSVFGPRCDMGAFLAPSEWGLAGLTASSHLIDHVQTYAFRLPRLTSGLLASLGSVFSTRTALSSFDANVLCKELELTRRVARVANVGSLWYETDPGVDPTLQRLRELNNQDFPFMKRSLLGKHVRFLTPELRVELSRNWPQFLVGEPR